MQGSNKTAVVLKKMGGAGKGSTKPNVIKSYGGVGKGTSIPNVVGSKTTPPKIGVAKNSEKLPHRNGPAYTQKAATANFHARRGGSVSSMKKKLGGRY